MALMLRGQHSLTAFVPWGFSRLQWKVHSSPEPRKAAKETQPVRWCAGCVSGWSEGRKLYTSREKGKNIPCMSWATESLSVASLIESDPYFLFKKIACRQPDTFENGSLRCPFPGLPWARSPCIFVLSLP